LDQQKNYLIQLNDCDYLLEAAIFCLDLFQNNYLSLRIAFMLELLLNKNNTIFDQSQKRHLVCICNWKSNSSKKRYEKISFKMQKFIKKEKFNN
jgi:hypothetical protein